jgi:hypothetical protein
VVRSISPANPLSDATARLDCREVTAAVLGEPVHRGPTWWVFRAPGRPDRHPSFGVTAHGFIDFATGDRGGLLALLTLLHGLPSRREAVRLALDLAGSSPPVVHHHRPRPAPPHDAPPAVWQAAALRVVAAAERLLWADRPESLAARRYLTEQRGLSPDTLRRFRVGLNLHWALTDCPKPDGTFASLPPGLVLPGFVGEQLWYVKVRCVVGAFAAAMGRRPETLHGRDCPKYLQLAGGTPAAAVTLAPRFAT